MREMWDRSHWGNATVMSSKADRLGSCDVSCTSFRFLKRSENDFLTKVVQDTDDMSVQRKT